MRLRRVSSWFIGLVLAVLAANGILLVLISQAYDTVVATQEHRREATTLAADLQHETEQLTRLVRSYAATGDDRYLAYYYDLLEIREGKKPPPEGYKRRTYWDDVIAGGIAHVIPERGATRSFVDQMASLGFTDAERQAFAKVVAATGAMKDIEQKAFAATQGLYDPEKNKFVTDGAIRLDYANQLVHGEEYSKLKAALSTAVEQLVGLTDRRTSQDVAEASRKLNRWILMSLICMAVTVILTAGALRVVRRRVLVPIHRLGKSADRLAAGDYSERTGLIGSFDEFLVLSSALDSMASAIQSDVTRREQTQLELEQARRSAELATHAKSMFLANMSHEIRTPMNAILGMSYLALKTRMDQRQSEYVRKIHTAATGLLAIINDILDFSKIEAGKVELELGRFRVEDVAGQSLALLRQRANEKDIELLLDVAEPALLGDSGALVGDALRLGQVLTNLLSNAIKFTHQGFVKLTVTTERTEGSVTTLRFAVRDTGIGMTQEQTNRLFQEFTQADGSTTRRYGGTGLGLTISKKLVELMGGRIWIESRPDQGSCFYFSVPFSNTVPPAPPPVFSARAEVMRVLVVDDQSEARLALVDLLRALGVGQTAPGFVQEVDTGSDAVQLIRASRDRGEPYDLLLLDWVMPDMGGAEVLAELQVAENLAKPVVVVVSAYDSDVLQSSAESLGAARFLPKPVLPESLRELVYWINGERPPMETLRNATPTDVDLSGMRLLLVEDNMVNQQLAIELLTSRGAEVDVASNGQEAVDLIQRKPDAYFDVVLMDLQMPVMDGYEATRVLRADSRFVDIPIVAMTAHAMEDERQRCLVLGMNGHISKPIEPDVMFRLLARQHASRGAVRPGPVVNAVQQGRPLLGTPARPMPEITGIDLEAGLRRADGRVDIFEKMLVRFMNEFSGWEATMRSMFADGDRPGAERLAHTLKGLAGTIGAHELQQLAGDLEAALRDSPTISEPPGSFAPVCHVMQGLLPEIARFHDMPRDPAGDAAATSPYADSMSVAQSSPSSQDKRQLRRQFRALLISGDSEARDLWRRHAEVIGADLSPVVREQINSAIDRYDFEPLLKLDWDN
jgi:two-component system sensor histidine kinase/response regulator